MSFDKDPHRRQSAMEQLSRDPRVTLGESIEGRMPLVTETGTVHEARELCKEIENLAGVQFVAVISVDFADTEAEQGN